MNDNGIPNPDEPSPVPPGPPTPPEPQLPVPPPPQPPDVPSPPVPPSPPIGSSGGAGAPPPPMPPTAAGAPGVGGAVVYSANGSYQYNPRPDIGAAFSWSFEAMKRYMKQHVLSALIYFGIALIAVIVYFVAIVGTAATGETVYDEFGYATTEVNPFGLFAGMGVMMLLMLVASVIGPALMLATAKMTADGEIPSVGAAWKRIPWGPVLGVLGLTIVGTFVGYLLCLIPGIVFAWIAPFMLVIAIDEGVGAKDAWDRMVELAKQNFWLMLGSGLLAGLVASAGAMLCGVGVLFTAPMSYLFLLFMYRGLAGKTIAWWQGPAGAA